MDVSVQFAKIQQRLLCISKRIMRNRKRTGKARTVQVVVRERIGQKHKRSRVFNVWNDDKTAPYFTKIVERIQDALFG